MEIKCRHCGSDQLDPQINMDAHCCRKCGKYTTGLEMMASLKFTCPTCGHSVDRRAAEHHMHGWDTIYAGMRDS